MKKIILFILMVPSLSFADVTLQQVQQAQICSQALFNCSTDLMHYSNTVAAMFASNFTLLIAGTTDTVVIPANLQTDVINLNAYQAKKTACVNAFNLCP